MSDDTKSDAPPDARSDEQAADADEERAPSATAREARDELSLALGHLGNAARKLAAAADPALRRAADEAEKALERASTEAEPIAKQMGDQLAGLTRSFVGAIDRVVAGVATGPAPRSEPAPNGDEPTHAEGSDETEPKAAESKAAESSAESGGETPPDSSDQNT